MQCSAVQYSIVQYSQAWYSAVHSTGLDSLHVLEGVGDPPDGDDVGELSLGRILAPVDPALSIR